MAYKAEDEVLSGLSATERRELLDLMRRALEASPPAVVERRGGRLTLRRFAHARLGAAGILALAIAGVSGASTASARVTTLGLGGWQVQSSAQAPQSARRSRRRASRPARGCMSAPTTPARSGPRSARSCRPATARSVFFSNNMKSCFGYMDAIGPDTIPMFSVPWWFRTDFDARTASSSQLRRPDRQRRRRRGRRVGQRQRGRDARRPSRATTRATRSTSRGLLRDGTNTLALEVYPNDPNTMFTLDNVDWTQIPPDNNTGIQFPIQLHTSGPLALEQRPRRAGRRAGPFERGADAEGRRHQPRRDGADRRAVRPR